jgi:hypothetical protein
VWTGKYLPMFRRRELPPFQSGDSILRLIYPELEALNLSEKSVFTSRHGVASREISFFKYIGVCGRVSLHQMKTHCCDKVCTSEVEERTEPESNDNH